MPGQVPGDGALSRAGGPVNGDNDFLPRSRGRTRIHPRLFVLRFGLAVKPYRLLLPALAPAVRAGVRPARVPRASVRVSFRPAVLRDNVPVRPDEPGLAAMADPLLPRLLQAPTDDFPLRVALGEWPFPLAERVDPGRASELRRGGRPLPAGWPGFRFRACGDGRLK